MTGGQHAAGALPVPQLTRKLEAEGVRKIVVLAEDVEQIRRRQAGRQRRTARSRRTARRCAELEKVPGVTVIIYDQECAAEKRRAAFARQAGRAHDAPGDPRGSLRRLRRLREAVQLHEPASGGLPNSARRCASTSRPATRIIPARSAIARRSLRSSLSLARACAARPLPEAAGDRCSCPARACGDRRTLSILVPGIGGTGVVTINALLATAAWIDGLSAITLDQTGLAQKGGAVVSSIILSEQPIEASAKIGYGNADLILGFDLLGAASADNLKRAHPARTVAVVNTAEFRPATRCAEARGWPVRARSVDLINAYTRRDRNVFWMRTRLAEGLFASHMAVNIFLLGVAYQGGLIPISDGAIEEAIRLNRVDAERNMQAFLWGRKYYHDAAGWRRCSPVRRPSKTATGSVERRAAELEQLSESRLCGALPGVRAMKSKPGSRRWRETVARNLYKLMAYKDEYEVARLLTKPELRTADSRHVGTGGIHRLQPASAAAAVAGHEEEDEAGRLVPRSVARAGLAERAARHAVRSVRLCRGAARRAGADRLVRTTRAGLPGSRDAENLALAQEIVSLPDQIRGYEHIKLENVRRVKALAAAKLAELRVEWKMKPAL